MYVCISMYVWMNACIYVCMCLCSLFIYTKLLSCERVTKSSLVVESCLFARTRYWALHTDARVKKGRERFGGGTQTM